MNIENIFKDIMKSVYAELKPLGYKKDGQNFRLFQEDGLCKIINFQRDRWNTKESIAFTMNTGIYFEKDVSIQNKKFKEYECLIRNRLLSDKWWHIDADADCDAVKEDVVGSLDLVQEYFNEFKSREETIKRILNNEAQEYSDTIVMKYDTAKMLADMGYEREVYDRIKDTDPKYKFLFELAEELRSRV